MTVVVREAREDELEEIARVLACAFEPHRPRGAGFDPAHKYAFERYLEEATNVRRRFDEAHLFVAVEDERILGTGTLYPPGGGRQYARFHDAKPWPDEWASLRLLAVDPAHRRQGIGRILLDARVRRARGLGASSVALHTSLEFAGARRLIERLGWLRCPEYNHAPAPGVHAEAYVLPLG